MTQAAVDWFVEGLQQRGVKWIATLCGHGLDPLFQAARRAGIGLVDTRNEQTASYIAEAYGRLTREPGVCAVSSGVAVANAFSGLLNAWFDSAPMLLISGSADSDKLGRGAFQDLDQTALARPITRYSRTIERPEQTLEILAEAWEAARHGPAHLMFPMDVQRAMVERAAMADPPPAASPVNQLVKTEIEPLAKALTKASRPILVAGSGVYYSGEAAALTGLAESLHIPVLTPIWDRGLFNSESPVCLGVVGAATGGPSLLDSSDCVILSGCASDYRLNYREEEQPRIFRLQRGWQQLKDALIDNGRTAFSPWLEEARRLQAGHVDRVRETAAQQTIGNRTHAVHVIDALRQWLPEDAVLIIDGGSIGQWAHQLLALRRYPAHWLTCGRSGVVGYGIGAAMAARLAHPDRAVVLLSGDGAFTFTVADLECAQRQQLHFTAIVADDQCWGITHSGHLRQFGEGISTQLGPIQFDVLARSLGCAGHRVDHRRDLPQRLRDAIAQPQPQTTVLHVPISGGNPA